MKKCNYCRKQDNDEAPACHGCGWTDFVPKPDPKLKPHKRDPEEDSPASVAVRRGAIITLKCRTPGEAYLVANELERADIIALLAVKKRLLLEYRKMGCVEVLVSAKTYEPMTALRRVVEFRNYKPELVRDRSLSYPAKICATGLGVVIVPGLLIYTWLQDRYKVEGYKRRAKELRLWFLLGALSWVVVFGYCFLFV